MKLLPICKLEFALSLGMRVLSHYSSTGADFGFVCSPEPINFPVEVVTNMKMNRVVDDQILHEPLPPDEPFLGGESTRLHGMSILNYWQWEEFELQDSDDE